MAFSNSYDWMDPDPFAPPTPPVWKEKVLGEIQYYYDNVLRARWKHSNTNDVISGTTFRWHKIDPSGDRIVFSDDRTITVYSGLIPKVNQQITLSGFVPVTFTNGHQIRSANASWVGSYVKKLKETRDFIQAFYGQNWAWIAPSSQASLYNLDIDEIVLGGTKYFLEAPHYEYIKFLREVPDTGPFNFIGTSADHSSLNRNISTTVEEWQPTMPNTAPHLAREQAGGIQKFDTDFPGATYGNCASGQIGWLAHDETNALTYSLYAHRFTLSLPLYKRSTSTLPTTQGLLLNEQNVVTPGFKGLVLNGPVINSNTKIKIETFSDGVPTQSPNSLISLHLGSQIDWQLNVSLSYYDEASDSMGSALIQYSFFEFATKDYNSSGVLINDTHSTLSIPTGRFSTFNFNGELTLLDDFPQYKNYSIVNIELRSLQSSSLRNGDFFVGTPGPGGTQHLKTQYIKGIDLLMA